MARVTLTNSGLRTALDFTKNESQGRRWEIPLHLWDALFSAPSQNPPAELRHSHEAYALLRKLNSVLKMGYDRNALQRRPHTVLLDVNFCGRMRTERKTLPPHTLPFLLSYPRLL